jgi:hypothetical protein
MKGFVSLFLILLSWFSAQAQPANNHFTNAWTLSGTFVSTNGSTSLPSDATKEPGEPNHASFPGGRSVWFNWTAPTGGPTRISTAGSTFNTLLAVYTGSAVNALTSIAANDNFAGQGNTSRVDFNAEPGVTYRIALDGRNNSGTGAQSGSYVLTLQMLGTLVITSPTNNTLALAGAPVPVLVNASTPNPPITRMDFYRGTNLFVSLTNEPFMAVLRDAPTGTNRLSVIMTDSAQRSLTSAVVNVLVLNSGTTILIPASGATFLNTNPITVTAIGHIPGSVMTNMEFFADGVKFGEVLAPPFSAIWSNITVGVHRLTAVGTDDSGLAHPSAPVQIAVAQSLVATGSVWRYLDNGSDPGQIWTSSTFDDGTWLAGPAQLGYGDGDEATVVGFGGNPNGKFTTTYFRRAVEITNATSFTNLVLRVLRDDGAVVYFNGGEVARFNMPTGAITYTTFAATTASDDGTTFFPANVSPNTLVDGTNTLAVEIHQSDLTSSDISFELELLGVPAVVLNAPPVVQWIGPTNGAIFFAPEIIQLEANVSDPDGLVTRIEFFTDDIRIGEGTGNPLVFNWTNPPAGVHFVRAVATDNEGSVASSASTQLTVFDAIGTPLVQLSAPLEGTVFQGPTNVAIAVSATTPNQITNVLVLANGLVIGEGSSNPFGMVWSNATYGTNILQAVAFDSSGLNGTSGVVRITVRPPADNTAAPFVLGTVPATNAVVGSLTSIQVLFSERVSGVKATDLLVNGVPANSVSGTGSNYVFSVTQPPFGPITVTWATNAGIFDIDPAPLAFDSQGSGATWSFELRDLAAPTVAGRNPPAGATVTNLTEVTVIFSEAVTGVDAADFLVNNQPAERVSSTTNTTYTFGFVQPANGPVNISWATGHSIQDLAAVPNLFNSTNANALWSYTLDTRSIIVQSNAHWRFIKGTAEASEPIEAWRSPLFSDVTWSNAPAPFFYGDPYNSLSNPGTLLSDMQSNYTSIYLRKEFVVPNLSAVTNLFLAAQSDDGFIAWINGIEVYRFNLSTGSIPYNAVTLTSISEPQNRGAAYLSYNLPDPAGYLVEGPNTLAIHAFNQSLTASSDFGFNAQLYTYLADSSVSAPRVLAAQPAPGEIYSLTNVTVIFTEPVSGVEATDLLVNGIAASSLTSETNTIYTFQFPQPGFGPVIITWDPNHGVVDLDAVPRSFDGASPSSILTYTLLNPSRPIVLTQSPPAGVTVTNLTEITVTFSESVSGVEAGALRVNGSPALAVTSATNTTYTFAVSPLPFGLVTVQWATNHGIYDLESPPNEFDPTRPGGEWSYALVDPMPAVSLVSPSQDAVFITPANISLQASATDNDGTIARVEFFANALKIGEDTNAPFAFLWRNVPPGLFSLFATAVDNTGRTATSAPVNVTVEQGSTAFVLSGTLWKYLDQGIDLSNVWREVTFDDSTWAAGPSELGYGDAGDGRPEATVVSFGPDANAKYVTTYFRHSFIVTNRADYTNLALRVVRDDGAVVHLNGQEAARFNMPTGEIGAFTLAATNVLGPDEARFFAAWLDPASLIIGTNVLAVEVHQFATNSGSADISFDLELIANLPPTPPTVALISPTNGALFLAPATITLVANPSDSDGVISRVEFFANGNPVGVATNAPFVLNWSVAALGSYTLVAMATDNTGLNATSAPVTIAVVDDLPIALVRGPYLQIGTATSGVVRWRTDYPSNARVFYGTNASNLDVVAEQASVTNEHIVPLTGLQPDTKYYYSIGSSTRMLASGTDYWFNTAPVPGTPKPTRVWVLGDPGTANNNQRNVRNAYYDFAAATRPADLWLMLGDNAYDTGTDTEYQNAVFNMYPATLRNLFLWPTIGNHETGQSFTATDFPYLHIFSLPRDGEAGGVPSGTEKYYSFDYANIHFICLDSMTSGRTTNSAMVQWLENELETTTAEWVVAFFHHPPYTKGNHNSDAETELIEIRQNVLPILEAGGVDLVLCGHSHAWERSYLLHGHYGFSGTLSASMKLDGGDGRADGTGAYHKNEFGEGTTYIVAGSSGQITGGSLNHPAHFLSLNELGSLVMDVVSNRLDVIFLTTNGVVRDHFTLLKPIPNGVAPAAPTELAVRSGNGFEYYRSQMLLRWRDRSTNEAGFVIERSIDGAAFSAVGEVGPNVTLFVDRGLDSATTYYYRVRSFNAAGYSAPSNLDADSTHPQTELVVAGSTVTFHGGAEGIAPVQYQWRFMGTPIFGETNESLIIPEAQLTDEGDYTVAVTDGSGRIVSNPAWLFVLAQPRILEQPVGQTNNVGAMVVLRVVAEGAWPLQYQWRKNGVPLPGGNLDEWTMPGVLLSDAGDYDVIIANDLGAVTSHVARLVINRPPVANPDLVYRLRNEGLAVDLSDLLANDFDPDGDGLFVSNVATVTPRGGTAILLGRYVFYAPPAGLHDDDLITYTIADTRGGHGFGFVTVSVTDNTPPEMSPIPNYLANVLTALVFTNVAVDAQSGASGLHHHLMAGAPPNARINPKTGVFRWTPTREQAPGTNWITIRVSDDGVPNMADEKTFMVLVNDYVEVSPGSRVLAAGQSGSVVVGTFSSAALSALQFNVDYPPERLTDVTVEALSPETASVSMDQPTSTGGLITVTAMPSRILLHTQELVRLHFTTRAEQSSTFVPLRITAVESVRIDPGYVPHALVSEGRIAVVGNQPLLEARITQDQKRELTLHGRLGVVYTIESSADGTATSHWEPVATVTLTTSLSEVIHVDSSGQTIFYRARE